MNAAFPSVAEVVPGLHRVRAGRDGFDNCYLLESGGELVLYDAGSPRHEDVIVRAIEAIGRNPADLTWIVVSHLHIDHVGSAVALRELTGAGILMSETDAAAARDGWSSRGLRIRAGLASVLMERNAGADLTSPARMTPVDVDGYLHAGESVPGLPGTELVATPGHCAGQMSLMWHRRGGILLAADAASNNGAVTPPPIGEDIELGDRTFAELAERAFDVAVFGHGEPVTSGARDAFRRYLGAGDDRRPDRGS